MRDRWKDGDMVDVSEQMMQLTLGIICKAVLNYDIESEARQVGKALTTVRKYSKRLQSPIGHVLDKIPILPAVKGARDAKAELDSLVYQLIADRRKRQEQDSNDDGGKNYYEDLLSRLMHTQDSDSPNSNQEKMSDKQVRDEVMTIFIAGHETTANALTWTFYLLSQNPTVGDKLYEELCSVLGDGGDDDKESSSSANKRTPTVDDVPKLEYTEKVFRESMRLYPPAWTIGRQVINDYKIDKYVLPAGSVILMSQYVMHHDPRYSLTQTFSIQIAGLKSSNYVFQDLAIFHLEEG